MGPVFKPEKNLVFLFRQNGTQRASHYYLRTCQLVLMGQCREKTCLRRFANNKGADQPAHPLSLFSAFIIRSLESTISKLATSEISIF